MRALLVIMAWLFIWQAASAQSWCPAGARWIYTSYTITSPSTLVIAYAGDTVIDMQPCKKLVNTRYQMGSNNPVSSSLYAYEQDDTVYFYYEEVFWPMYYFNAAVGDTLLYRGFPDDANYLCDSFVMMLVDSVDHVIVNGDPLRYYRARMFSGRGVVHSYIGDMEVVEKFGAMNFKLFPYINCNPQVNFYEDYLRCYEDSAFAEYRVDTTVDCNWLTTPVDDIPPAGPDVFPNPASGVLMVSGLSQSSTIRMYNLAGVEVMKETPLEENAALNISYLKPGMYIVQVIGTHGRPFTAKVVVK